MSDIVTDATTFLGSNRPRREEIAMNYRLAIIVLGVAIFIAAMIPYAYKPRCSTPDCTPEAPYFGERGGR
jgi:hypothetical protein